MVKVGNHPLKKKKLVGFLKDKTSKIIHNYNEQLWDPIKQM